MNLFNKYILLSSKNKIIVGIITIFFGFTIIYTSYIGYIKYKMIMIEKNYNGLLKDKGGYIDNGIIYNSKNPGQILNVNQFEAQDPKTFEAQDPKTKKSDDEMYVMEQLYIKDNTLKKDNNGIVRNSDGAVIPEGNAQLADGTRILNGNLVIKPQNYDNDDYLNSTYFLDEKVIDVIRKVNMSNPEEILDIEFFKFSDGNNQFTMDVKSLEDIGFNIDHKNGKLIKTDKLLNKRLDLGIDNEYRLNQLKSSLSYKLILDYNKKGIIIDNKKDLLKIENVKNFINIDFLDKNNFLLIIDKNNKKVYFSLLEGKKGLKLQLNKQYLLEGLYGLNKPENIKLEIYGAIVEPKSIKGYDILPQLKDIDFNNLESIDKIQLSNPTIINL